jgi:hypothetical protein
MNAKKEAIELVQLFYNNQCSHSSTELAYSSAKQCALICVREIVNSHYVVLVGVKHSILQHYSQVILEIHKL